MGAFLVGVRLERRIVQSDPDALIPFFTAPLFTVIFLMIVRNGGRHDLEPDALLAPVLMTLWWFALYYAGNTVTGDRWQGILEWILAAPASFVAVQLGRIALVMLLGPLGFVEVWGIGRVVFGIDVSLPHPLTFALTLLATLFTMTATATLLAGLYVLSRGAYTFANSASFPFYVLGGVFVPVAILPGWIRPVTSAVFTSWSSDLLRASLKPGPVHDSPSRLGTILLIGVVTLVLAQAVFAYVLGRMRRTGELAAV